MISYFPTPYKDELLYSIIARFHIKSGNLLMCDTLDELFNNKRARSSAILPTKLGIFAENIKHFKISFDEILLNHTLFPFFMVFSNNNKYDEVYRWAKNSESGSISLKMGLFGLKGIYDKLRFCTLCCEEEIKEYGESYWHREHQTSGSLVCIKHNEVLMESKINFLKDTKYYYDMCHDNIYPSRVSISLSERQVIIAAQISRDINYLYSNYSEIRKLFLNNCNRFSDVFLKLLEDKKLVTEKRNLIIDEFKKNFINYYSSNLLEKLGVPLEENANKLWIVSMCRKGNTVNNTVKYILMADFLCGTLENFINTINNFDNIDKINKRKWNRPDKFEEKLEEYRKRWVKQKSEHPDYCQNDIRKEIPSVYTWLNRHDSDWLKKNSPMLSKHGGNKTFDDWIQIDEELSLKVKVIVDKLLNKKGKPTQITFSYIEKELGYKGYLKGNKKSKLPKTMAQINKYVEDTFSYRLRRLEWAITELKELDIPLAPSTILRKSGINHKDWDKFYIFIEELNIHNNMIS